ncbi:MAG: amidohydrolase family protein [Clostridia bacterium]|nr:amidohydrolase family protein [Clostridia bacterium]
MIIDTHTHIFPDPIAVKATEATSGFYGIPMEAEGSLARLLRLENEAGVDMCVVCSAATTSKQTQSVNDYIASTVAEHCDFLRGLGAMHQDYPDKADEVKRIKSLGLRGIKIHPDIQRVAINDRRFFAMYEAMQEMGLTLLAHTGDTRYTNSNPEQVLDVLDNFPRLSFVGAHFGCWSNWDEGSRALCRRDNISVDCSSSLYALEPSLARDILRRYGADRVMFGSDFPMWTPAEELGRLDKLRLTGDEKDKVLYKTAKRVYGI